MPPTRTWTTAVVAAIVVTTPPVLRAQSQCAGPRCVIGTLVTGDGSTPPEGNVGLVDIQGTCDGQTGFDYPDVGWGPIGGNIQINLPYMGAFLPGPCGIPTFPCQGGLTYLPSQWTFSYTSGL